MQKNHIFVEKHKTVGPMAPCPGSKTATAPKSEIKMCRRTKTGVQVPRPEVSDVSVFSTNGKSSDRWQHSMFSTGLA